MQGFLTKMDKNAIENKNNSIAKLSNILEYLLAWC